MWLVRVLPVKGAEFNQQSNPKQLLVSIWFMFSLWALIKLNPHCTSCRVCFFWVSFAHDARNLTRNLRRMAGEFWIQHWEIQQLSRLEMTQRFWGIQPWVISLSVFKGLPWFPFLCSFLIVLTAVVYML